MAKRPLKQSLYAIVLFSFIFCGCTHTVDCSYALMTPVFTGYDLSDIDTLVLRKYKADDGFNSLIDTFLITKANAHYDGRDQYFIVNINVGDLGSNGLNKGAIQAGYDWQLFVPAVNRTVAISAIRSEHQTMKVGPAMDKTTCIDKISSFRQDGVGMVTGDSPFFYVQR